MSIQVALAFFRTVRDRPELRQRIAAWGPAAPMSQLEALADELGLACSATDLDAAFRHDWVMRWLRYTSQDDAT
jgi:hypothetical protein